MKMIREHGTRKSRSRSASAVGTPGNILLSTRYRSFHPSQSRRNAAQWPRSTISAEGTTGNSPGIHSWGSGARPDTRSPESRRDGGGCKGWMFRRPYGTRLVEIVPWKPGLRKAPSWAIARRPYGTRGPGSPSKTVRAPPPVRLLCSHRCGGYDLGVGSSCSVRCGLIEVCDEDTPAAKRRCHCGQGAER